MSMRLGHRFSGPLLPEAFTARGFRPAAFASPGGSALDVTLDLERIPVWNQGSRGSCVTHAGLFCMAYVGAVSKAPSRHAVDYHCRLSHGEQCIDEGTWPHVLVAVASEFGVPDEELEPYTDEYARRPCDFAEQQAYDRRITVGHALDGDGSTLDLVEEALRCDVPVFGGWRINAAFKSTDPDGVWDGCGDVSIGGHSMSVVGVRYRLGLPASEDARAFLLRNSWGPDWKRHGHVWVSARAMAQASDVCAFGR